MIHSRTLRGSDAAHHVCMLQMTEIELIDDLIMIIADRLSRDAQTITAESHLIEDLGFDSLELSELLMDIEDRYSVKVQEQPRQDIFRVATVRWLAWVIIQESTTGRRERDRSTLIPTSSRLPTLAPWTQYIDGPSPFRVVCPKYTFMHMASPRSLTIRFQGLSP
jgi:acyl carrier protein